ncbi:MAG: helix-turn-helix domain-containing protein [Candidatus Cryptobacteroides sp.]
MDKIIEIGIGSLSQLVEKRVKTCRYEDSLEIICLEGSKLNADSLPDISVTLKVDAFNIILTMAGSARMEVNSELYEVSPDTTMNLIGVKMLRNVTFSDDYKGYHLMVSKSFYNEVFKEGKHLTPETAMYKTHFPYDHIRPEESLLLEQCILDIIGTIGRTGHIWYRRMVETTVRIFFMEVGNILIARTPLAEDYNLSNYDILFYRFMNLLHENSSERKSVGFYADKLCLSPDYLAQAIKTFSQKPVSYWINEALVMQAKAYLIEDDLSIKQIVTRMNFSDQSSFGRFFRKNTGMSPAEYRKLFK